MGGIIEKGGEEGRVQPANRRYTAENGPMTYLSRSTVHLAEIDRLQLRNLQRPVLCAGITICITRAIVPLEAGGQRTEAEKKSSFKTQQ